MTKAISSHIGASTKARDQWNWIKHIPVNMTKIFKKF